METELDTRVIAVPLPDRSHDRTWPRPTVQVEVEVDPSVTPTYCPNCGGFTNCLEIAPAQTYKIEGYGCICD